MRSSSPRGLGSFAHALGIVLTFVFLALAAPRAGAGIADLAKGKAKEVAGKRATPAQAQEPAQPEMTFDDVTLELTGERIEQVLKGVRAGEGAAFDKRPLIGRRDQMQTQAGELMNRYGRDIDDARAKHDDAQRCIEDALEARAHQRQQDMEQKARTDPAMLTRMMQLGQKMAMAQATGDTAALRAVQAEMMGASQPTREDSAAARQKCGPVPKLHPMGARIDSLQAATADIDRKLREQDEKSMNAQVTASGLSQFQLAMAKERVLLYLQTVQNGRTPRGFSKAEMAALEGRRPQLLSALGKYLD